MANMACSTNASRSASGMSVSSTTSRARSTESARMQRKGSLMSRKMTQITAAAITAGLAIAWQLPAAAAPGAATPTISIGAKSALPKVTGDVLVVYRSGTTFQTASISGDAANAMTGEVIRLFGQKFPYKKAPAQVG